MNIRFISYAALAVLAFSAVSCAKNPSADTYESSKKVLEAWLRINYPDLLPSGRGIYVIDSVEGTGEALDDSTYFAFTEYNVTDLEGNYIESTDDSINMRLGTFVQSDYYGAKVSVRNSGSLYAGVEDMLDMMRVGGYMKALIPSWLLNTEQYDNIEDYYKDDPGGGHYIYEVWLVEATDDIYGWEKDTLESYSRKYYNGLDSLKEGFYYKVLDAGTGDTISKDSTIYIRYIGKLLNGHVFDTNIKDTAIKYGLYSSEKDYDTPAKIGLNSEVEQITLDGSSVVQGFAEALYRIPENGEVVTFFWSQMGYGTNGSGNSIPPFSPLVFQITMVDYEEDE